MLRLTALFFFGFLLVVLYLGFVSAEIPKGYGFDGVPYPSVTPTSTATVTASPVPSDVVATSTPTLENSPSASPDVDAIPEFSSIGFLVVLVGLISVILVLAIKRSSKHEP